MQWGGEGPGGVQRDFRSLVAHCAKRLSPFLLVGMVTTGQLGKLCVEDGRAGVALGPGMTSRSRVAH